jgi:hypothetical protein
MIHKSKFSKEVNLEIKNIEKLTFGNENRNFKPLIATKNSSKFLRSLVVVFGVTYIVISE